MYGVKRKSKSKKGSNKGKGKGKGKGTSKKGGNDKNSKKKKIEKQVADVMKLIQSFRQMIICNRKNEVSTCLICWSDGACKDNPGESGCGCFIEFVSSSSDDSKSEEKSANTIERYKYIGRSKSGLCELLAIELVLDTLISLAGTNIGTTPGWKRKNVHILSDSTYCVNMFTKNWNAKENIEEVARIVKKFTLVKSIFNIVTLNWVPAHQGIPGNEKADELANLAVSTKSSSIDIDINRGIDDRKT
jgi:ribonuclease HI